MKIKTKLYALLASGCLMLVLMVCVMFFSSRTITAGQQAIQITERFIRSAADLRMLGSETVLFHEARSVDQWQRKMRTVHEELKMLEVSQPIPDATLQRIRKNIESADAIHTELQSLPVTVSDAAPVRAAAEEAAYMARNFSALIVVIQDVIDSAGELNRASRLAVAQSWRSVQLAVALVLLAMLAQLAFMGWLMRGSILRPLAIFVAATRRIAAGDYGFRLNLPPGDEIGALAGAFNAMSTQVQQTNQALLWEKENLAITLNSIGDAVIATDAQGLITRMNPVAERLTAWPLHEALGQPLHLVFNIISAEKRLPSINPVQMVMANGKVVGLANHTALLARDGKEYQIADSAAPILDATNTIVGVVLVFSDVSEKYLTQAALANTAELLERTGALAKIGGWEVNLQTMKLSWTRQTFQIAEREPSQEISMEEGIQLFAPEVRPTVLAAMQAAMDKGTPYDLELPITGAKGTAGWVRTQGFAEMRDGKAIRLFGTLQDITQRKAYQSQLEHMAHFDALTNLPNRVLLADRLQQAMLQAQRRQLQLSVVYLDLDGFKTINDQFGHETGDQVLITLAKRLKEALREGDTLARIGGDEFVAVLSDLEDTSATLALLHRMMTASALPVQVGEQVLKVSASLGVTFYPQANDIESDQLLRQADQAMYQAKLAGKNRYQIFDAAQDSSLRVYHESLERIRLALAQGEFVLHYQPKVNMRTGQVIGAEALIRWQHPDKGLLSPMAFLPVIEDHPLARDVGEWVIDTALTQIASWRALGLDLPVSVNIGARQLQQGDFVQRLQAILAKHPQVSPTSLGLEILETSALSDMDQVAGLIEDCAQIGVTFALDDFGTGYSSLTYLKRLRVAMLKIDQSFVRDMLEDSEDLAILQGVIGLAEAFKREVIAEGVETVAHGAALLQLGCEQAQGYGIARPMPPEQLPAWAATWQPDVSWRTPQGSI